MFYRCKNVLKVLYHHAMFGGARILPAAGAANNVEFFCMSVGLFVRHAVERQGLCIRFSMKALEYRTILIPSDMGRFACSTFSDCRQLATPQNAEVQRTANFGVLAARGRQNKPTETKFGTLAYTVGLLYHTKFGPH